jgi:nucleotide-binding universal stress UspA family protein
MGRVVVGVDGSPGAIAALRFAVDEARLRGATLQVVHASEAPEWSGTPGGYVVVGEPASSHDLAGIEESYAEAATQALESQIAGVDTSGVEVAVDAVSGDPARALLDAAEGADLLVVGSRGRGGFRGLVLGSTSQKVAHHAPCPVVIVRSEA